VPAYPSPSRQFLARTISRTAGVARALSAGGTTFVVDPTIVNPSATNPNCQAIIGSLSVDNFGNATGLSGWGIATFQNRGSF
jgi:glycine/D-amino acid oxidase-like deaminating enzyme